MWMMAKAPSVGDGGLAPMVTLRRPRNYPSGATEMRWTGTLLRHRNSPSEAKETRRALLKTELLTSSQGEYKYHLSQRARTLGQETLRQPPELSVGGA